MTEQSQNDRAVFRNYAFLIISKNRASPIGARIVPTIGCNRVFKRVCGMHATLGKVPIDTDPILMIKLAPAK